MRSLISRFLLAGGLVVLPGLAPSSSAGLPVVVQQEMAAQDINPERASGYHEQTLVKSSHFMVATANPLASRAAFNILDQGGNAFDAIIAAQLVLNLVEPQSSGIGGGAFIVAYDAGGQRVQAYDGRETAPAAARSDRFMHDGKAIAFWDAVNSGRSVGTPGVLRALELMHRQHGHLPWQALFAPAITLAQQGFPVSERLHGLLAKNKTLREQAAAAAYFYDKEGKAWPVGYRLKNPQLAQVFQQIATEGVDAFYKGKTAQDIVDAIAHHQVPGDMTLADLAGYQAKERKPVCAPYKKVELCGMPPPSSGPIAVIQMLGILSHTPIAGLAPDSLEAVHYFAEAGKLAYADRDYYVADPDFVDVPVSAMINADYLARRAALIRPERTIGRAPPGDPVHDLAIRGKDDSLEIPSTTHLVAADADGNVVSMTSTIESEFGSKIFVDGFLLNNQLTDFSLSDKDQQGRLVVNRVEPLKRPRSSMSPMIVLEQGKPVMAIGSPGGSAIINFVAKTILGVLDWGLNIQQAIDLPNRGSRNTFTELEKHTDLHALVPGLRAMGHDVREIDFPSGLQGIVLTPDGLEGGADPRREGLVLGR
jgi:gamma-glutamyltranspeptidase/glutathione hydrolase